MKHFYLENINKETFGKIIQFYNNHEEYYMIYLDPYCIYNKDLITLFESIICLHKDCTTLVGKNKILNIFKNCNCHTIIV